MNTKEYIFDIIKLNNFDKKDKNFKRIFQKYGKEIWEEEEEVNKILKKLSEKNKKATLLTNLGNTLEQKKFLTIENLLQELFILKQKKNEDEACIKMLKVQIRKLEKDQPKSNLKMEKKNNQKEEL